MGLYVERSGVVDLQIVLGRYDELRDMGYARVPSLMLAFATHVDLAEARDLLARGCSQATALRILL